jgi:hypothetical protein
MSIWSVRRPRSAHASDIHPLRTAAYLLALVVGGAFALGASCSKPTTIQITSPVSGTFSTASNVLVTGQVKNPGTTMVDVTVNGISVLPLAPDGTFTATVSLDPSVVFNPIVAELTRSNNKPLRSRVTVIAGDSVADGDYSPMGVALRLNDSGLDQAEPLVSSLVDLDPATLLPVGTTVIQNYCAIDSIFGCLGRVDVRVATPAPSISGFGISVDAQANDAVAGNIGISGLDAQFDVIGVSGIAPSCGLHISASGTNINGSYGLQPLAADPSQVDVFQNGAVAVNFTGFNQQFTSGLCDFPLIGDLIQLIVGNLQGTVESGFEGFLNAVDPQGNTPVAGAIETALAGIEISGPIGQAIGVDLETPLFDVYEDADGITLDSDARITASLPAPGAPDLPASYHVNEAFPPFGTTTPVSGTPYDMAISISSSAFNQLLKSEVESGLLLASITEFDLGGGPLPLNALLMSTFVPEFALMDPATPLRIDLQPTLAPVVTGNPGPNGELLELRMGHLLVDVSVDQPGGARLLRFAVDVATGLDVSFSNGQLSFVPSSTINPANINVTVLDSSIVGNEPFLQLLVQQLGSILFPELAGSLDTFPLPDFLGLQLGAVEVSKSGSYTSLFFDLAPAP